jgi:hypothetical protein
LRKGARTRARARSSRTVRKVRTAPGRGPSTRGLRKRPAPAKTPPVNSQYSDESFRTETVLRKALVAGIAMLNHSLFRRHQPVREPVAPSESVWPAAAGRTRKLQRCSPGRTIRQRCTATSSPSRGRASMTSTRLSCPHRLSLASLSRRTSARASSLARSRCQPTAVTPAGSSAVCPSAAALTRRGFRAVTCGGERWKRLVLLFLHVH